MLIQGPCRYQVSVYRTIGPLVVNLKGLCLSHAIPDGRVYRDQLMLSTCLHENGIIILHLNLFITRFVITVLDITRISVGPQLVILDLFSYITFYSHYNRVWTANRENWLGPKQ